MKITVKIGEIEVTVDRPNISEPASAFCHIAMEKVVIPTIEAATRKAKELYELSNK